MKASITCTLKNCYTLVAATITQAENSRAHASLGTPASCIPPPAGTVPTSVALPIPRPGRLLPSPLPPPPSISLSVSMSPSIVIPALTSTPLLFSFFSPPPLPFPFSPPSPISAPTPASPALPLPLHIAPACLSTSLPLLPAAVAATAAAAAAPPPPPPPALHRITLLQQPLVPGDSSEHEQASAWHQGGMSKRGPAHTPLTKSSTNCCRPSFCFPVFLSAASAGAAGSGNLWEKRMVTEPVVIWRSVRARV